MGRKIQITIRCSLVLRQKQPNKSIIHILFTKNDTILIKYVFIKLRIGIYKPYGNTKIQYEELQQKKEKTVRGDKM